MAIARVASRSIVTALRSHLIRRCGASFFLALVLVVFLEHRAANADFNDDGFGYGFESFDTTDGEEILSRLILVDNIVVPAAPSHNLIVARFEPVESVVDVPSPDVPTRASRAPPAAPLAD
jgi:hypothetical protein